ncbi:acyltransferase [Helicobacter cetorum]|uniref:acyltransferase n=1 Tax=Helicobacter cetorum TaxID=138563 RepID=UPI000CF019F5|nr:acyltransferase [Helicobacter cetorum]
MEILQAQIKGVDYEEGVRVIMPSNLYGCTLKKGVFVGPFCEIQSQVVVGEFTRIQSHSFVCSLVNIGVHCFIGHGVMFINDLFENGYPNSDKSKWKSTFIGNHVSIGSNATILPVRICDGVVIGAGSVVTKDIEIKGVYAGNPARLIREL